MKKLFILGMILIGMLGTAGCADGKSSTSDAAIPSEEQNVTEAASAEEQTVTPTAPTEEQTSATLPAEEETVEIPETEPEPKPMIKVDSEVYTDTSLPCQEIFVMDDEARDFKRRNVSVKDWEGNVTEYLIPEECFELHVSRAEFADIDDDGTKEIIVEGYTGNYFKGLYVLDTETKTMLKAPEMVEGSAEPGITYTFEQVDKEHVNIILEETDYCETIFLTPIAEVQYAEKVEWGYIENDAETKKQYLADYYNNLPYTKYWEGFEIEERDGKEYLVIKQHIMGPHGINADILGYINTGVCWDSEGEYHLMFSYYEEPPEMK